MFQVLEPGLLQTFVAIVDTGSFTRAARRVCRTQSAVSMQMKRLEEVIGRPLIDRTVVDAGRRVAALPCAPDLTSPPAGASRFRRFSLRPFIHSVYPATATTWTTLHEWDRFGSFFGIHKSGHYWHNTSSPAS